MVETTQSQVGTHSPDPGSRPGPRLLRPLSRALRTWITPCVTDPDEAFRESAIRFVYPVLVVSRPLVIIFRHEIQAIPVPPPLTVELLWVIWAVLAAGSLLLLRRRRLTLSSITLLLIASHADLLGIYCFGYWNAFLLMTIMLEMMIAAVLLPVSLAQLFTRFFRGEAGRQSGVSGTGLGLAIAKEIVDRHRGAILVEDQARPGRRPDAGGATFTVWLPV